MIVFSFSSVIVFTFLYLNAQFVLMCCVRNGLILWNYLLIVPVGKTITTDYAEETEKEAPEASG